MAAARQLLEFTHFFRLLAFHSKTTKKSDILLTVFGRIPIAQKTTKRNVAP